jgi:hypothetical protein
VQHNSKGKEMTKELLALLMWAAGWVSLALMAVPTIAYLFTGWKIRRDKLLAYLDSGALQVYYSQFPYNPSKHTDLPKRFRDQFNYLYGRRHFVAPMLLFTGMCVIGMWISVRSVQAIFHVAPSPIGLPRTALFALAGGFIWVLSDQLARIAKRDIGPKDVYGWAFRLILCIPFGLSVAHVANEGLADTLAFFMGTFPTQTLFTLARRIASSKLNMGDDGGDTKPELCCLQSVGRANAETFIDQGIDTIAALAWTDPVDLTIRTNFDFSYVLDCMSQALLWVYFEGKTRTLFPYSLRGSQEAIVLIRAYDRATDLTDPMSNSRQGKEIVAAVTGAAAATALPVEALLTALREVVADPYTQFIANVWK